MEFHLQGIANFHPSGGRRKRLISNIYSPLFSYIQTKPGSALHNVMNAMLNKPNIMDILSLYNCLQNKDNFKIYHWQSGITYVYLKDILNSIIMHSNYFYNHSEIPNVNKYLKDYKYHSRDIIGERVHKLYFVSDIGGLDGLFLGKSSYKRPINRQVSFGIKGLIGELITGLRLEKTKPCAFSYCVKGDFFQRSDVGSETPNKGRAGSRRIPFGFFLGGKTSIATLLNLCQSKDNDVTSSPLDQSTNPDRNRVDQQVQIFGEFKTSQLSSPRLSPDHLPAAGSSQDLTKLGTFSTRPSNGSLLSTYTGVTKHVENLSSKTSAYVHDFNDPLWRTQWYAHDYRTQEGPVMDHNLVPVYRMGITGASVKIAIVDDGVQHGHPDLKDNHLEGLSWDMCQDSPGANPDPAPAHSNSHGTKCAGEIAMVANNGVCGVGVAPNAKFAGVKTIGPRSVEYMEGRSLIHRLDVFDIYSNSWGPPDDGLGMERLGRITATAIRKGVTQGRNGKGSIYTFAGGNGKHEGDTCSADGMVNDPHVIAVAAAGQRGRAPYYSERCAAILCTAYSGGEPREEKVTTVDLDGECSTSFSGTSAAVPIATGIIALALDANSNLTYRDVMHLITMGSEVAPLANNEGSWYQNGVGFWVSNDFGFGLLNAENMVRLAMNWTTVPPKNTCTVSVNMKSPKLLSVGYDAIVELETTACEGVAGEEVRTLEQLEITSTVQFPCRGAISINVTSPAGTETSLLEPRPKDMDDRGLVDWTIKSVHCWGEDPRGIWLVRFRASAWSTVRSFKGLVKDVRMTLHGTAEMPAHHRLLPRGYAAFRLPNGQTSQATNT